MSRTPRDVARTDEIEGCGFNIALNTDSAVYITSVAAFCRDISSTYC